MTREEHQAYLRDKSDADLATALAFAFRGEFCPDCTSRGVFAHTEDGALCCSSCGFRFNTPEGGEYVVIEAIRRLRERKAPPDDRKAAASREREDEMGKGRFRLQHDICNLAHVVSVRPMTRAVAQRVCDEANAAATWRQERDEAVALLWQLRNTSGDMAKENADAWLAEHSIAANTEVGT